MLVLFLHRLEVHLRHPQLAVSLRHLLLQSSRLLAELVDLAAKHRDAPLTLLHLQRRWPHDVITGGRDTWCHHSSLVDMTAQCHHWWIWCGVITIDSSGHNQHFVFLVESKFQKSVYRYHDQFKKKNNKTVNRWRTVGYFKRIVNGRISAEARFGKNVITTPSRPAGGAPCCWRHVSASVARPSRRVVPRSSSWRPAADGSLPADVRAPPSTPTAAGPGWTPAAPPGVQHAHRRYITWPPEGHTNEPKNTNFYYFTKFKKKKLFFYFFYNFLCANLCLFFSFILSSRAACDTCAVSMPSCCRTPSISTSRRAACCLKDIPSWIATCNSSFPLRTSFLSLSADQSNQPHTSTHRPSALTTCENANWVDWKLSDLCIGGFVLLIH